MIRFPLSMLFTVDYINLGICLSMQFDTSLHGIKMQDRPIWKISLASDGKLLPSVPDRSAPFPG